MTIRSDIINHSIIVRESVVSYYSLLINSKIVWAILNGYHLVRVGNLSIIVVDNDTCFNFSRRNSLLPFPRQTS